MIRFAFLSGRYFALGMFRTNVLCIIWVILTTPRCYKSVDGFKKKFAEQNIVMVLSRRSHPSCCNECHCGSVGDQRNLLFYPQTRYVCYIVDRCLPKVTEVLFSTGHIS